MPNREKTILWIATAAIIASIAPPVFAQTTTLSSARRTTIMKLADQESIRRLTALNALSARVNAVINLSVTDKTNLLSSIQNQIHILSARKQEIDSEAMSSSPSELKDDVDSITAWHHDFALILSQGTMAAAADRALSIVGIMNDLGTKFSARIQTAQSAGNNVTAATATLTDFNNKVSDANTQTTAAISDVVPLVPDDGDAAIAASNTAALKDARAKIVAAQQDFVAARTDAQTIIKALATWSPPTPAAASTTSSTSSTSPASRLPHPPRKGSGL